MKDAELSSLLDGKKKAEEKITQLTASSEEMSRQLTEAQETLKNNENVINWLNKQLNEQTVAKLASAARNTTISTTRSNAITSNTTERAPLAARTFNSMNTLV